MYFSLYLEKKSFMFLCVTRWQVLHHTEPDGYMITIDAAMMKVNKCDYDELRALVRPFLTEGSKSCPRGPQGPDMGINHLG